MRDRYGCHGHGHDRHRIEAERSSRDRGSAAAGCTEAALACFGGLSIRRCDVIDGVGLINCGGVMFAHSTIMMMARYLDHFDRRTMMSRPASCHGMDGVALQRQRHCKHPRQYQAQDFTHRLSLDQSAGTG